MLQRTQPAEHNAPPAQSAASAYPWVVTGILTATYAVAFIDRQIINLLVDPIKKTLLFSDTTFSLLQGLAFVLAYVLMGVVFGRLADRSNRRNLLILGTVIWCAFTALCGAATGFWSFFGARAGIGAAEACLLPAAWSMLADYFSRERLPRAMSIFLMGPFIGGGLALIFGGLLFRYLSSTDLGGPFSHVDPWRLTFLAVGMPGVVAALLLLVIVREPPRHAAASPGDRNYSLRDAFAYLVSERAYYGSFFGGVSFLIVGLYALPSWTPAFLMRAFGGQAKTVGVQYGFATLIAGSLGVLLGPLIAKALSHTFPRDAPVRTAMVAAVCAAVPALFLPFASSYTAALLASAGASCCLNFILPVAAAALQVSTPPRLRGFMTSVYAFVLMTIGFGLGPTAVAVVTDRLLGDPAKVGIALGWVTGISALLSLPLLRIAARHYAKRIERA